MPAARRTHWRRFGGFILGCLNTSHRVILISSHLLLWTGSYRRWKSATTPDVGATTLGPMVIVFQNNRRDPELPGLLVPSAAPVMARTQVRWRPVPRHNWRG